MTSSDDTQPDLEGEHGSIWLETTDRTDFDPLDGDVEVDVAVVGGGIAGVTAASTLQDAGRSVALVERNRIVEGVTGRTTAKLTALHGCVYAHLVEHFGEDRARQYAEANQAAIDAVESTVEDRGLDCDFERVPAYTYVEPGGDRGRIEDEVEAARRLDLPASLEEATDLPFETGPAIRLDDQAHFHPRKYLLALAEDVPGDGSQVFEGTTATDVTDGAPCEVSTDGGTITTDAVVVATHFPAFDRARYYERLSPKRSYVLATRLQDADAVPEGMYYQPDDGDGNPYFSVRPHPAGEEATVLVGGQNHRTGHGGSTIDRYRALERQALDRFDVESVEYRWSTQDFVSVDRVPFVGRLGPHAENAYVATGFGGWGMTNGVAAGRLLADLIVDGGSPRADVYDPMRFVEGASSPAFEHHNAHDVKHYLEDPGSLPEDAGPASVSPGQGTVLDLDDGPTAVYRDEDGDAHAVSAFCTHMGCLVHWNDGDRSWDCPCHGSRFDYDGSVIDGPANSPLSGRDDG